MDERTCLDCSVPLSKKPGVGRWPVRCARCRARRGDQAKYLRLRNDPEKWQAYLAKRRATYVPKPPRPIRLCEEPGCDGKHLAKGMCRLHWRRARYPLEAKNPTMVIGSMASLHGAYFPKSKPIKVRVTVGVMAYCPRCDTVMGAASETYRCCPACGTTAELNQEEVSWVISEKRSTAVSTPTRR